MRKPPSPQDSGDGGQCLAGTGGGILLRCAIVLVMVPERDVNLVPLLVNLSKAAAGHDRRWRPADEGAAEGGPVRLAVGSPRVRGESKKRIRLEKVHHLPRKHNAVRKPRGLTAVVSLDSSICTCQSASRSRAALWKPCSTSFLDAVQRASRGPSPVNDRF